METPQQVAERTIRMTGTVLQMERCDLPGTPENISVVVTDNHVVCRKMQVSLAALIQQQRDQAVAEMLAEMARTTIAPIHSSPENAKPAIKMCMRLEYVQGDLFPKVWFEAEEVKP